MKKETPVTILGETCTSQCSVNFARAVFAKPELQKNILALQPLTKKRARLSLSPSLALFPFFFSWRLRTDSIYSCDACVDCTRTRAQFFFFARITFFPPALPSSLLSCLLHFSRFSLFLSSSPSLATSFLAGACAHATKTDRRVQAAPLSKLKTLVDSANYRNIMSALSFSRLPPLVFPHSSRNV